MTYVARDQRHVNQSPEDFKKHFRIFKSRDYDDREKPWLLYLHVSLSRWRKVGVYKSQQKAMKATDIHAWLLL